MARLIKTKLLSENQISFISYTGSKLHKSVDDDETRKKKCCWLILIRVWKINGKYFVNELSVRFLGNFGLLLSHFYPLWSPNQLLDYILVLGQEFTVFLIFISEYPVFSSRYSSSQEIAFY